VFQLIDSTQTTRLLIRLFALEVAKWPKPQNSVRAYCLVFSASLYGY